VGETGIVRLYGCILSILCGLEKYGLGVYTCKIILGRKICVPQYICAW
jgi:hypothetical protein